MVNCECGNPIEFDKDSLDVEYSEDEIMLGGVCPSCKKTYHVTFEVSDKAEILPKH